MPRSGSSSSSEVGWPNSCAMPGMSRSLRPDDRIASRSYIGAMHDDQRARLLDDVQTVLERNGIGPGERFTVPTVTRVIWARAQRER